MAQLLLEWTRTDTVEPAARALVAPLRDVPGPLLRPLAAYLDAESSLAETAAVLGVHRNTVAVRVARIGSLPGVDLSAAGRTAGAAAGLAGGDPRRSAAFVRPAPRTGMSRSGSPIVFSGGCRMAPGAFVARVGGGRSRSVSAHPINGTRRPS
ncbi:helix-turn-helix domain-containing protein [Amycolatopsis sp. FDAARGOS 1241]|uniref:helix-turn-helix domain-containing protein n=1 Tax=Amycolatopsis sp. FDAARGOS 1241 TaxID=2778070 RepID=UPI001EF29A77|nr:helix-turn-helix domain-containing protein [Amycolatopsis sp. FDAARGOS 1241]